MTEILFSLGYKLAEDNRWELRLNAERKGNRGYFVLCILGPPPVAPVPRSSPHCCHCSKANKARLQLRYKEKRTPVGF